MTLILLKSTGKLFCKMSLNLGLTGVFLIRLSLCILGKNIPEIMLCPFSVSYTEQFVMLTCPITDDLLLIYAGTTLVPKACLMAAECSTHRFPLFWEKGNLCGYRNVFFQALPDSELLLVLTFVLYVESSLFSG